MTTAAVKAAAVTIKICFFIDRPRVGVEFSIFNIETTDPRVTRITDGVATRIRTGSVLYRQHGIAYSRALKSSVK
jgi:hypothetical protein